MSNQIEADIQAVHLLLKSHIQEEERNLDRLAKGSKILQVGLYCLVLIIGVGITWGVTSSKLAAAEQTAEKVLKLEEKLQLLEIKSATDQEILKSIRSDISEIKDELKKINRVN